jgi:predicted NBD/HSP70 family sugar kinase
LVRMRWFWVPRLYLPTIIRISQANSRISGRNCQSDYGASMNSGFQLMQPRIAPPLDGEFRPAVLADRAFHEQAIGGGVPLVIGLEREAGKLSRFETLILAEDHPGAQANFYYVERLVKFLLWQRGGFRLYVGGPRSIGEQIRRAYSEGGARAFDFHFMGDQVYEKPFLVEICEPEAVPATNDGGEARGGHLGGHRIGFDLGASDRKVSAVVDGAAIFSEEKIWNPSQQADPAYHYGEIMDSLKTAAARLERVDAVGGSSAGIYINNRPMVASLFRGIPPGRMSEIRDMFLRIAKELNVPVVVINDGDVAALAGSMSLEDNGVLGIALGSSEAAGYVDASGRILGWLNELSFAPVDYSPTAPVDEWSGDIGCGSTYFSQQCVFRLASKAGIELPHNVSNAEKLAFVQEKLETGHEGAVRIWQTMGVYLGYGIAHYADFYDLRHVMILGRCTSGKGGTVMSEQIDRVLQAEFPDLARRIHIQLPDERSRRVGQAIAAASLPALG